MFKELNIKTVPVTLKAGNLARIAINLILGEPMLRLVLWHTASQEVLQAPDTFVQRSRAALCRAVQAALAGLHMARERCKLTNA